MKRHFLSAIATLFLSSFFFHAFSQAKWPAITQTHKPWTRWWWQGSAVNKTDLTACLDTYAKAGLGGVEITPIYGVRGAESQFISFLSPQWMEMLRHVLGEGKRLGIGVDMATGTGWPFGGPWVTPEDACKNINVKTYTLEGGQTLGEAVTFTQAPMVRTVGGQPVDIKTLKYPVAANDNLQQYAFDQLKYEKALPLHVLMAYPENGQPLNLTANVTTDGRLNWTAPAGKWTLYALFQGWHGKLVERAAPGGEGDVIDHFDKEALDHYLGAFDKAFNGHDLGSLRSFFNDSYEVDDARGQANWSPGIFAEFLRRRGYDLKNNLPALFAKDTPEKNMRVLSDYRQTVSELLLENFTKPWHQWAKSKNALIRNQSHGSPANILDLYAAIDIPETEGDNILRFKFATSAANVTGKPLASAEAATWLGEHFQSSLGDVKIAVDKFFLGGVNHIFYHGTNYSPKGATWPGWLFYAAVHFNPQNSFWKDFPALNQYVARCQSFLQSGKPDNDVLVYFPIHDRFAEPGRDLLHHFDGMEGFENTVFHDASERMMKEGYAFDLVSDKQLLALKNAGTGIASAGGRYQTIVLPAVKFIPNESFQKILQLAEGGATVILHRNLPIDAPGYAQLAARQAAHKKMLARLKFGEANANGIRVARLGKGTVLSGDDLGKLLQHAKIRRESLVDQGLQYTRRQWNNGYVYFLANHSTRAVNGWVPLHVKAGGAFLYDPTTGASGVAKTRRNAGGFLEVYADLAVGGSQIVHTTQQAAAGSGYPYLVASGDASTLSGDWTIRFLEGGPELPASTTLKELRSWTDLPGDAYKKFSGTASYATRLPRPAGNADAWLLNLNEVEESAEVLLNNKKIATLIGPTFQVVIPARDWLHENELEIRVTNGMANRIVDLEQRGVKWKIFYNTNFPSRLPANRGSDGLFTAAKWQPKASGLIGPVTLTPVRYEARR